MTAPPPFVTSHPSPLTHLAFPFTLHPHSLSLCIPSQQFEVELTRKQLELLCEPLLQRLRAPLYEVALSAGKPLTPHATHFPSSLMSRDASRCWSRDASRCWSRDASRCWSCDA